MAHRFRLRDVLTLTHRSPRFKQRFQREGTRWHVAGIRSTVGFSSEKGPWLLMRPETNPENGSDWFWMRAEDDARAAIVDHARVCEDCGHASENLDTCAACGEGLPSA